MALIRFLFDEQARPDGRVRFQFKEHARLDGRVLFNLKEHAGPDGRVLFSLSSVPFNRGKSITKAYLDVNKHLAKGILMNIYSASQVMFGLLHFFRFWVWFYNN